MDADPARERKTRGMTTVHRIPLIATRSALIASVGLALLCNACAAPQPPSDTAWLPIADGWQVRDIDRGEPMRWVLYQRDALFADVKELRIVGLVDGAPLSVARALRDRLLDDSNLPEGLDRKLLSESEAVVEYYALSSLPFPFDDRQVHERLRFSHDADSDVHAVHVTSFDPGQAPRPGVVTIPLVQNTFVIAPVAGEQSVVTMDTVHDLGGHFPNWVIYGPIADHLVQELLALNKAVRNDDDPDTSSAVKNPPAARL